MSAAGLPSEKPRHVAIIMDGNGRWAVQRHLPRIAGHRAGVEAVRQVVRACLQQGVPYLTLFAFSSENWRRPRREVTMLMDLFLSALSQEAQRLHETGVRLEVVGDLSGFSPRLQRCIHEVEAMTADNRDLTLSVAANYGGRWDVAQATRTLAARVAAGTLAVEAITEEMLGDELATGAVPDPDLFIRTGGEKRISNFLLWQLAYAELYFTECLWPDFGAGEFEQALEDFSRRQRRFGQTSEQIARSQRLIKV